MTSSRFDGRTYNGCTYDETTIEQIEPMPDWTVAKETWRWSWSLHIYGVTCLSLLLALYASCSLVNHCYQNLRLASASYNLSPSSSTPPTLSLVSKSELTLAQSFVVLSSIFSAVHLVADPYESNCFEAGTTNPLVRKVTRVLRFASFPVLIGSTVCLQLVILRMSRVTLYPRCLQRSRRILGIFLLNLCILAATDCVAMHVPSIRLLLLLSRGSAIWWALVVCFVFVYKGVQIANFADIARHSLHEVCARNKNRQHHNQWTRDGAVLTTSVDGCNASEQRTMNCAFLDEGRCEAGDRTKDKSRKGLSMGVLRRSPALGDDDSLQSDMTSIELSPQVVNEVDNGEARTSICVSETKKKRRSRRNQRISNHRHHLHHHHCHHSSTARRHRCSCDSSDDQVSMNDYATDTTSTFIHYRSDDAARSGHEKLTTTAGDLNSPLSASSSYALASFASPVSTTTTLPWTPGVIATDDLLNPNPGNGFVSRAWQDGKTPTELQNDFSERTAHIEQPSHSSRAENGIFSDTSFIGILNNSWDNGYMGDTETPTLSHRSKMSKRMILMTLFRRRCHRESAEIPTSDSVTNTDCIIERWNSADGPNGISFINMQYSDPCIADDDKRATIDGELGASAEQGDSNCRRFPLEQIEGVPCAGDGSLTLRALREGRAVERSLKAICSMALLLFICCILHMYAMFGVYGVLSKRKTLEPWPWYIYQTIVRYIK